MRKGKLLLFIIGILFTNLLLAGTTRLSAASARSNNGRRDHEFNCLAGFRLHLRPGCKHFTAHGVEAPPPKKSRQQPAVDVYAELRQGRNDYTNAAASDAAEHSVSFELMKRLYCSPLVTSYLYLFSSSDFHGFIFRLTPF